MTFKKQFQEAIDPIIFEFLQRVHQQCPTMNPQEGMILWKKVCKKKRVKKTKRFSGYNLFVREQYKIISRKDCPPNASFGDVSKCVGRAWKSMSPTTKENYKHRASLYQRFGQDETWCHYIAQPFARVFHIAKNWLEDIPHIVLSEDMSKEEVLELLIRHRELPESQIQPSPTSSPETMTTDPKTEYFQQYQHLSYPELLKEIRITFPGFSDVSDTSREDLLSFLVQHRHGVQIETKVPIEVHPYYHELRKRSLEAIQQLYRHNFKDEKETDRRKMIEALVRNFDTIDLSLSE